MGGIPHSDNCVRLGTFLTLDDIEFDVIALFQSFVAVQLDCRVVDEHIGAVIASDESVALGVVEPLDFAFVLSHRLMPSLRFDGLRRTKGWGDARRMLGMTEKDDERLIESYEEQFIK
jgi:hypothetical protein